MHTCKQASMLADKPSPLLYRRIRVVSYRPTQALEGPGASPRSKRRPIEPRAWTSPRNRGAEASPGLPHGLRAWCGSAVRQGTRCRFRGYPPPARRARKVRGGFETDRHREPGQGATGISDRFCREPRQPATGTRDRFYRYSGQENRRKPAKALANLDHNFELCSQTSKEQQPAGGVADWQGDESWKHRSASKRIRCHR